MRKSFCFPPSPTSTQSHQHLLNVFKVIFHADDTTVINPLHPPPYLLLWLVSVPTTAVLSSTGAQPMQRFSFSVSSHKYPAKHCQTTALRECHRLFHQVLRSGLCCVKFQCVEDFVGGLREMKLKRLKICRCQVKKV